MTLGDVQQRVAYIAALAVARDDEAAHAASDALWNDVLEAIAANDCYPTAQALARAALGTAGLDFSRWYA